MIRVVVRVAVVCCLTTPGVGAADDGVRYVTLTGSGASYADVRFAKPVAFDAGRSVYDGGRQVVGFYARHTSAPRGDESASATGVWFRGFAKGAGLLGDQRTLPAGTYRLYLVADGPATVRIAVTGQPRGLTVRANRPARLTVSNIPLKVTPEVTSRYVGHRAVRVNGGNRLVVTAMVKRLPPRATPAPTAWGDVDECVQPLGSDGCPSAKDPTAGYIPWNMRDHSGEYLLLEPGFLDAPALVHQHYAGVGRPVEVRAAVFELSL